MNNTTIEELIIPKASDTGKTILEAWGEHKTFASKYQDDLDEFDDIAF